MTGHQVVEYIDRNGNSPYAKWFQSLDAAAAAKVTVAVLRMTQGNLSNVKWFSGIGEYKIDFGPGYRIYLSRDGERLIILLGGGSKKMQQKDIESACEIWVEYKTRKRTKL